MQVIPLIQIAIGNELLSGASSDTNSRLVAQALRPLGIQSKKIVVIPDSLEEICTALKRACAAAPLVVVSGGLGPTTDDLTRQALADFLQTKLILHGRVFAQIEKKLARHKLEVIEGHRRQAMFPPRATILDNPLGSAPGFMVQKGDCRIFCLPGVPSELEAMLPQLQAEIQHQLELSKPPTEIVLRFSDIRESELAYEVDKILTDKSGLFLEYRPHYPEIVLTVRQIDKQAQAERAADKIAEKLRPLCYASGAEPLTERVLNLLIQHKQTLAVAESCTGGMLAAALTDIPGSSQAFLGGYITYSNQSKIDLVSVPADWLEEKGAVSQEVALSMAAGACRNLSTTYGIGISGIAGPDGGTAEKPVGTVEIALVTGEDKYAQSKTFFGHRDRIRRAAVFQALLLLFRLLSGQETGAEMSP